MTIISSGRLMLLDRLGEAYAAYSLGTWRLFPPIY